MMGRVAEHHDKEVNRALEKMTSRIEMIVLLAVGLLVGLLAAAIFLPMWEMTSEML